MLQLSLPALRRARQREAGAPHGLASVVFSRLAECQEQILITLPGYNTELELGSAGSFWAKDARPGLAGPGRTRSLHRPGRAAAAQAQGAGLCTRSGGTRIIPGGASLPRPPGLEPELAEGPPRTPSQIRAALPCGTGCRRGAGRGGGRGAGAWKQPWPWPAREVWLHPAEGSSGQAEGLTSSRLPGPVPGSTLVGGEGESLGQAAVPPSAALAFPSLRVRRPTQCQGQDAKRV